ncbi:PQQ-dependent sugar dehydrogenase [Intrasporangium sp.]|uniref:PQQ-dependent sugar dehydrogenase n=1 Tax=Intrasporangium sp. TaxID=1925024 RepID=UPI0032221586
MTHRRSARVLATAVLAVLAVAGCTTAPEPGGASSAPSSATSATSSSAAGSVADLPVVADRLETPWSVAFLGQTPFVSERDSGRILELDAAGRSREVATIVGVSPRGEAGLLGIAIRDNRLYVYPSAADENRIDRALPDHRVARLVRAGPRAAPARRHPGRELPRRRPARLRPRRHALCGRLGTRATPAPPGTAPRSRARSCG